MQKWSVKAILIKVVNIYKSDFRFENLIDPHLNKIIIRFFLDNVDSIFISSRFALISGTRKNN
jgi:hypothetical protein